jgi:hypothetical protein
MIYSKWEFEPALKPEIKVPAGSLIREMML